MLLESAVERKLGRGIKRLGGLYYKFVSPGNTGVPDRLIILPGGRVVFVELKTDVGQLSPMQKHQIERMLQRGADIRVIYGTTGVDILLQELGGDAK